MKPTPMYLSFAQMYLDTKDNENPLSDFVSLMVRARGVNYGTAEVKWKLLHAAYTMFTEQ